MNSRWLYSDFRWFKVLTALVIPFWVVPFCFWMYHNYYVADPYNPALAGTARYGHNGEDDFWDYLKLLLAEVFVLLVVLRPYSLRPEHWLRWLVALILFGGWTFLLLLLAMHGGGVNMIHLLCVMGLAAYCFLMLVVSAIVAGLGRKSAAPPAEEAAHLR